MCGIVGLFLKNPELEGRLGQLTATMLGVMTERGPDSAGFAVYNPTSSGRIKLTLRSDSHFDFEALASNLGAVLSSDIALTRHDDHAVLSLDPRLEAVARQEIARLSPKLHIMSVGAAMELYKGVGLPDAVSGRLGLATMTGTHAIGHTRMATESAVTIAGSHPFSTGSDQCLVHNGSLSNHNAIRRKLEREGQVFETENDSEVAAGYLSGRMAQGARLDEALTEALSELDGFYTFVVGTKNGFGVLRDPVACKPAVMAETDDYVAFGSEYRALVDLPGIENAHLFEPEPKRVYFWEREA